MQTVDLAQKLEDLYPSRQAPVPGVIKRKDPVVHGGAEDGPLSAEELARFERDGYLWLPGFLDADEVNSLHADLERTRAENADSTDDEVVREPGGEAIRSIFRVHETRDFFQRLCADPRFADRARQLLGGDVYVHQSRINAKPGFQGKEFFWHSDFETWHVEDGMPRMRAVSCVVTLTPNRPYNGPLMVMPGSHKEFIQCVGETPEDHFRSSLRAQEIGVPDERSLTRCYERYGIDMPTGPAGSVLFFDCNLLHGSNGNISPEPRANLFFVYNSVENAPGAPFGPAKPRPAFLASRDTTPVSDYAV